MSYMEIEEAIKHSKEVAKEKRKALADFKCSNEHERNCCIACVEEHEQLAEWLEQLSIIQNLVIDWETKEHNYMYMDMISKVLRGVYNENNV